MKRWTYIILSLVVIFGIIQLIPGKFPEKSDDTSKDLLANTNPPEDVAKIIRTACYDCHSYQYTKPWYGNVAPSSWLVANHINEGTQHLNFSKWTDYSRKTMLHKLDEIQDEISGGDMPLNQYTWMHKDARLTQEQRDLLTSWFKELSK